jgi:hypothetical protein
MASEENPNQQGESTGDTLEPRVEDTIRASMSAQIDVITYPEELLKLARKLIDDEQFSIAAVVCHMACELATERTLSVSFVKKGLEHLREPVLELFSGYSLANKRHRDLYTALTGDEIQQQPFWQEFKELATLRNRILHRGRIIVKEDAEKSLKAAHAFVAHLKQ